MFISMIILFLLSRNTIVPSKIWHIAPPNHPDNPSPLYMKGCISYLNIKYYIHFLFHVYQIMSVVVHHILCLYPPNATLLGGGGYLLYPLFHKKS